MSVAVKASGTVFEVGVPKELFQVRFNDAALLGSRHDVTADGQRFLVNVAADEQVSVPITVVENWMVEARRAP